MTDNFDSLEAARQELAKRELARRRLMPFIQKFNHSYEPGWVHKDICQRLEKFSDDVIARKSPRLMLFMPPRHGKSEIATRNFPAWHMGRAPQHEIIASSYSGALAMKFSRKARSIVRDPEFSTLFPDTKIDETSASAENWLTTEGGGYLAAGVGGGLTGNGAHVGIIDDPVKNREEAESENTQQNIIDWYTSTFYTRLAPGGGVLVILTRWHDNDLAGWLLREMEKGGDQWEVVVYPAIATKDEKFRKKGEPLHQARYPLEALHGIKRAVGARDWQALYQQNPVSEDGDFFQKKDFRYYRAAELPPLDELSTYTAWDMAIGTQEMNDYSVGVTVGIDRRERIWVLDVVRGQWGSLDLVEQILDTYAKWRSDMTGIEKGVIEMALGPFLETRTKEREMWDFSYTKLATGKRDKALRARPMQGRMQQGMVFFPEDAPWFQDFQNEFLRFPSGVHDDQVDALAWIGQMMQMFNPVPEPPVVKPPSWKDKLSKFITHGDSDNNWRTA
ncbi:phage terminase large subunit [Parendozoicomonas haliclonae]|uniref:Terminase-like family protein n=1 Tax=Parendozoicomonas haliclonae TaxID=1960125 RepID=A0A1X7AGM8_9GAMM|nr:phage terminase large subunit [Parendozoicomonas haliclonae]SMA33365.1 Terminase-like family protein [Parendozoicomonas haliclonae]